MCPSSRHLRLLGSSLLLALAGSAAAEPRPIPTKITAVTVYADRAQITRTGVVDLSAGGERVVVAGLPGWIDDESVRVSVTGATARVLDVAVERTFLAEASEEAVRKAEAAVNETADALAAVADEEAVLAAEIVQLEAARAFSFDKLPRDLATREVKITTVAETVDFVADSLRKSRAGLRELALRRRTLGPELQARTAARDELASRAQLQQRSVTIELDGRGRGTLVVTYMTPGATWEPVSELRSTGNSGQATLAQLALVVQTTGEDWEGAALAFSTQRSAETLAIPEVTSLLLGGGGPGLSAVIGSVGDSWGRAASVYALENEAQGRNKAGYRDNRNRQIEIQARAAATFESLSRRGTTSHFPALSSPPVRADGRPIRVPIGLEEFAFTPRLVAVPEVSPNAVRTAEIVNTGARPVLPGKVSLFVDGAFVGTTELPFVAPGETFTAYLGVHDRVKLGRSLDRRRSGLEQGKRRTELRVSFVIEAENLGDEPITLDLGDRVPVAAVDSIEVDKVRVPEGAQRDTNGIVRWTATVAPRSRGTWLVEYELEYDNDMLVREASRKAAAPAPARALFNDIEALERDLR